METELKPVELKTPENEVKPTFFRVVIQAAFELYKDNFLTVTKVYAISVIAQCAIFGLLLIGAIFSTFSLASLSNEFISGTSVFASFGIAFLIFLVIIMLPFGLVTIFQNLTTLRSAYEVDQKIINPLKVTLKNTSNKFLSALGLFFRIFIYTYMWVLVVFRIIMVIIVFALIKSPKLTVFFALYGYLLNIITFIISLAFMVFIIKKVLKTTFAMPLLLSHDDMTSKQALDRSIELSNGIVGRIFCNYFLLSLAVAITFSLIFKLVGGAGFIFMIPVSCFVIVFQYIFMKKAVEEKERKMENPLPAQVL